MSSYPPTLSGKAEKEALPSEALPKHVRELLDYFSRSQNNMDLLLPTTLQFRPSLDIIRATLLRSALANSRWSGLSNSTKDPTDFLVFDISLPTVTTLKSGAGTTDSLREIICSLSSSTESPIIRNLESVNEIETLFETARGEIFEYGIESSFSKDLVSIVRKHGKYAILEIAVQITHEKADSEVAHETLRCLGRLTDSETHDFRLWLLKQSLSSSSAKMRDGAIQGLAFLGDRTAKPALEEAAQREQIVFLKTYIAKVVATLEYK